MAASTSEKIMMEFESSSDKLVTHLFNRFQTDTQHLDRYNNENVYQQSAARYIYTLKEQLTSQALQLIEELNPDILVKGGDWPVDKIVGAAHVIQNGGEVHSLPFVIGYSTSNIIQKIKEL